MTCKTSDVAVCCSNASRLGDQPCVLHRDDRLRREVLQQHDLFVGERSYFLAVDCNRAKQRVVLSQRHDQVAPGTPEVDKCATAWVAPLVSLRGYQIDRVD